jgi:hypothetical protein
MADEPPSISAQDRLIAAALAIDYNYDLRRILEDEDAVIAREFVLACRAVRDLERTGEMESDAD